MERRLTCILAADLVDYSRLVSEDEVGTLSRFRSIRTDLIEPLIARYGGRVVKLMGDGFLVEFASVVDTVECAIAWQTGIAQQERQETPRKRFRFRIGVHLGDVVVEGEDILGNGVNVAARLEGIADPGTICISEDAQKQVRDKLDISWENLGQHCLKNIQKPVKVYCIRNSARTEASMVSDDGRLPSYERPSIAVLPFANMSGDPEQEFFADGITEDLITALSKIRWFFVIARNSTFAYKGKSVDISQVADELGVRYVLEGSVRKSMNRIRVAAQLIDASTAHHVWAEAYDRELDEIFALQDEMTQTIVGAVEPELGAAERARAARKPPESLDAWDVFQKALWHMWRWNKDDNKIAQDLFRQVQDLDSGFATAFARESYSHYLDAIMGWSEDPEESVATATASARQALNLDDGDPVAYFALGRAEMLNGSHDSSIGQLQRALKLDPNFAQAHHGLGMVLALPGRLDEAEEELIKCLKLSPRDPLRFATETITGFSCLLQSKFQEAMDWADKAIREPAAVGGGYWPHAVRAAALAHLDRGAEAQAAIADAIGYKPDLTLSYIKQMLPTKTADGLKLYLDGLRRAGLPN